VRHKFLFLGIRMQEAFLHFLWQFQYFNRAHLQTTDGDALQVLHPGYHNTDAGPDFSQARIRVGDMEWAGNVEIHLKSSDWLAHHHDTDDAYDPVVLHVVWQHDREIFRQNQTPIPTLVLEDRTPADLLSRYHTLVTNAEPIPCAAQFGQVKSLYKIQALENALMQRLAQKALLAQHLLHANNNDWEETTYQLLARNMGFKLNSEPFLQLAQAVPLKLLHKHSDHLLQMEALLFGQAGFLEKDLDDAYYQTLQKEYAFLSHKYSLAAGRLPSAVWKFLRLRPANFPTLRIAHLAALLQTHKNLFSLFIHTESPKEFMNWLQPEPSPYWQRHYTFSKLTASAAVLGKESKENILVNTVVPLLVCYAREKGNHAYLDKAIHLLEQLPAENNRIIRIWKDLGLSIAHAFDSQGSIELYNQYCLQNKCLSCPVGMSLLKPAIKKQTP
jgi:hypothetical protein